MLQDHLQVLGLYYIFIYFRSLKFCLLCVWYTYEYMDAHIHAVEVKEQLYGVDSLLLLCVGSTDQTQVVRMMKQVPLPAESS